MNPPCLVPGLEEVYGHALALLAEGSERGRRLALLCIDRTVTLMLRTYFALPEAVTGLRLTRRQRERIDDALPGLIDALEKYAAGRLAGVHPGELRHLHALCVRLYDGGSTVMPEAMAAVYAELVRLLYRSLFNGELPPVKGSEGLSAFLSAWAGLERMLACRLPPEGAKAGRESAPDGPLLSRLPGPPLVHRGLAQTLGELQRLRGLLVAGGPAGCEVTSGQLAALGAITAQLECRLRRAGRCHLCAWRCL